MNVNIGRYGDTAGLTTDQCTAICPDGYYCPTGSITPTSCPLLSTSISGATIVSQCFCAAGAYGPMGPDFSPVGPTCTSCPSGSTSSGAYGSSTITTCTCKAGWTGPNGGPCTQCEAGTFKAATGSGECTECLPGTFSAAGSAQCAECSVCVPCQLNPYTPLSLVDDPIGW
jgi:hypothetical protein